MDHLLISRLLYQHEYAQRQPYAFIFKLHESLYDEFSDENMLNWPLDADGESYRFYGTNTP